MELPRSILAAALGLAGASCTVPAAAESFVAAPTAKRQSSESGGLKSAIFAGGCFWGVEAVFSHVKGVTSAVSGYHGGTARSARYDIVSSGVTNHAEVVRITYDPALVRYDQLLRVFFSVVADPTLENRQGPDVGSQYRAALIPTSADQEAVARAYLAQLRASRLWKRPLVTGLERAQAFYPAEAYHQDFAFRNPDHGYIKRWDAPKVDALKRMYPSLFSAGFRRN